MARHDEIIQKLVDAPAGLNPVLVLYREMNKKRNAQDLLKLSNAEMIEMDNLIDQTLHEGQAEQSAISLTGKLLKRAPAMPASVVPVGF